MRFSEFIFLLVKSLNPGDYRMLITRKKREAISYFLMLLLFSVLIGFFFSIPKLAQVPEKIETNLMKIERFNITNVDVSAKEPIVLAEFPKIVLDFTGNETNTSNDFIRITKSDLYWKKFAPNILEWKLFENEQNNVSEYGNILQEMGNLKGGTYWLLFLFLLPSLLVFTYIWYLLKYMAIILVFTIIGFIIAKIKNKKIRITAMWRTAVFSSTLMIITEVGIFPLFNYSLIMSILPLVLFFIMFLLSILVIIEKEITLKEPEE